MSPAPAVAPLFVIDDDPTGAQGQADVPLLLSWPAETVKRALRGEPRALHLLTNSRALDADGAYAAVRGATGAALAANSEPRIVLRGDSTLRAHLLPEYAGIRDALAPGSSPPLLLVPALPAAGRITRDGRHWLVRDGKRVPLDRTEFASDGDFAYSDSRLLNWAEERSGGFFAADLGIEIGLDEIRSEGGSARVTEALLAAGSGDEPAVVVPDAETVPDLRAIAAGLREAWRVNPSIVVRCAPAFASVLSGAGASSPAALPAAGRGLLVVVGSHVPTSSAQLAMLATRYPGSLIELNAATLAGPQAPEAAATAIEQGRELLRRDRIAIVATGRSVKAEALGPEPGMRVARALAAIVDGLRADSEVLLSKGGITSAVNVLEGLHADRAQIVGPVAPGVSLWMVCEDNGTIRPVIVFPGNVGAAETLAELVTEMVEG